MQVSADQRVLPTSGALGPVVAETQAMFDALFSGNSGPAAPASPVKGMSWLDTTTPAAHVLKFYDGAQWITVAILDPVAHTFVQPLSSGGTGAKDAAGAVANLKDVLDTLYRSKTAGWYEFNSIVAATGTAWLWDLPADAKEWRLTMRGVRPASGAANLAIRCGSTGAPADSGASDYENQNIVLTGSTFVSGRALQASPSPFAFTAGIAPKRVVAEGNIGSANDVWTLSSAVMGYLSGSVVGLQFSNRQALGRKPRLFLSSDVAIVEGDLIMELRN